MELFRQISLLGSGAWGTTIANLIAKKGMIVRTWDQNEKVGKDIASHRINDSYLPGIELSKNLTPFLTLKKCLESSDLLILAVPSKYLVQTLTEAKPYLHSAIHVLVLTKGLLFEDRPLLVSDVVIQYGIPQQNIAILSGPNFALEIARDLPAATAIGGWDENFLQKLQALLSGRQFRVYTNMDPLGVQLGGMMKNVIALSAGIIDGIGLGSNLKSALIVRGVVEMNRVFLKMGASLETLYGLSGLGDLIATSMSELSRNHWAGYQIGKGLTYEELKSFGRTVEGIETLPSLLKMAELFSIELPICRETYEIIFKGKPVLTSIEDLMNRAMRSE